jgi:hypothetical protein
LMFKERMFFYSWVAVMNGQFDHEHLREGEKLGKGGAAIAN